MRSRNKKKILCQLFRQNLSYLEDERSGSFDGSWLEGVLKLNKVFGGGKNLILTPGLFFI